MAKPDICIFTISFFLMRRVKCQKMNSSRVCKEREKITKKEPKSQQTKKNLIFTFENKIKMFATIYCCISDSIFTRRMERKVRSSTGIDCFPLAEGVHQTMSKKDETRSDENSLPLSFLVSPHPHDNDELDTTTVNQQNNKQRSKKSSQAETTRERERWNWIMCKTRRFVVIANPSHDYRYERSQKVRGHNKKK